MAHGLGAVRPILFCVCETDSVAPAVPTLRYAAKAPRGEVRMYPEGHFVIYLDPKPTQRSSVSSPTNLLFSTSL
jgi:hypothetical protein